MQRYALADGLHEACEAKNALEEPVWRTVGDFVQNLRIAGQNKSSHFYWPSHGMQFENCVALALHLMPPGKYFSVKSSRPWPAELLQKYNDPNEKWHLRAWLHGTCPSGLLGIMRSGFARTVGAGCDGLKELWGFPITGTYQTEDVSVAIHYPTLPTYFTGRD